MPSSNSSGSTTPRRGRRPTPRRLSSTTTSPTESLVEPIRLPDPLMLRLEQPLRDASAATSYFSVDSLEDLSMWRIEDIRMLLVGHLHLQSSLVKSTRAAWDERRRWRIFSSGIIKMLRAPSP